MPPKEQIITNDLPLLRQVGTEPMRSLAKVTADAEMSAAMTRITLRSICRAMISRKKEDLTISNIGTSHTPEQRDGAEPVFKMVRVAMKPPTSKSGLNEWDESINWEANSKKWEGGLTSQAQKTKLSQPAFVLGEIPYDEWRKHYAKDKTGKYRGTEAPAENCILLPEDEIKWRSGLSHGEVGSNGPM